MKRVLDGNTTLNIELNAAQVQDLKIQLQTVWQTGCLSSNGRMVIGSARCQS